MSYQDKTVQCCDCNSTFTFSADEQEQFASRGYTNEPKRCPSCRMARKRQLNGNNSFGTRSSFSSRREMFPVKCSECGKDTQVPFEPRGNRPVYCSDCYSKIRVRR